MDKLERLEKEFNEANDKKLRPRETSGVRARLERAKKLIGGLGGERTRTGMRFLGVLRASATRSFPRLP